MTLFFDAKDDVGTLLRVERKIFFGNINLSLRLICSFLSDTCGASSVHQAAKHKRCSSDTLAIY